MADTAPQQQSASPETSGTGVAVVPSLEERSAAAFGTAGSAAEGDSAPPPAPSTAESAALDERAKARAERRAALEAWKAQEREKVDYAAARREQDTLRKQLEETQARLKAYERYVDPSSLTKEQFFALAERNPNLTPTEIAEWLRDSVTNPERAAARVAEQAIDPKLSALEKRLAEQQAVIDRFMAEQQAAQQQQAEQQAAHQFFSFTEENAASSPHAAWYLKEYGAEHYYELAKFAAQRVPEHAGPQAILDEVEEMLWKAYSKRPPETGASQRRQAPPSPHLAAAQAPTTISNTLAQQRSSVVDEDEEWSRLPFEERSARLFR